MKHLNQNKKRQASVSTRPKRSAPLQKKYILESKKSEPGQKNIQSHSKKAENNSKETNEDKADLVSNSLDSSSINAKVSPQVIRTAFDSIKVYLENMKAFYLNQAEKLNTTVKQIDQKVEFVVSRK